MISGVFRTLNNFKIRTLAVMVIGLVLASGTVFVGSSVLTSIKISDARQVWTKYRADTAPKALALTSIVEHVGYGGMIHHFKNYVLRKDTPRIAKFRISAGAAMAALGQYANTAPDAQERAALGAIRKTVVEYGQKLKRVTALAAEGKSAREIDRMVKISDKAALAGIATLTNVVKASHDDGAGVTKTELVAAVQNSSAAAADEIDSVSDIIGQLKEISGSVAAAIEEQTTATAEIAKNVQEAAAGTSQVSEETTNLNQLVTKTGSAAQDVEMAAAQVSHEAGAFEGQVNEFLQAIRAL